MKTLRVWLLVLLAIALPMRSAMAAAMPCAPTSGHAHAAASTAHGHPAQGEAASHVHPAHDHESASGHDGADKCSFCASCCSATAPVASSLSLAQAPPAVTQFPEHRAPAAEFFSGGQERPPRSI
ncbi:hypothetical protein ACPWT1_08635 [Ramlibacter sp. MMS24-I3-19]|uniref:hypothetical protein n=1 Tax=Ramlibacter sp. MMS24-I3-19 TaxID=3416606 RepID=UPI003D0538EA